MTLNSVLNESVGATQILTFAKLLRSSTILQQKPVANSSVKREYLKEEVEAVFTTTVSEGRSLIS